MHCSLFLIYNIELIKSQCDFSWHDTKVLKEKKLNTNFNINTQGIAYKCTVIIPYWQKKNLYLFYTSLGCKAKAADLKKSERSKLTN